MLSGLYLLLSYLLNLRRLFVFLFLGRFINFDRNGTFSLNESPILDRLVDLFSQHIYIMVRLSKDTRVN